MGTQQEISQRDLRLRSREIMDAVEHGTTFTVTRDGRGIGELIPLRRAPRFLSRDEIIRLGAGLGPINVRRFRLDLDGALDGELGDSYAR